MTRIIQPAHGVASNATLDYFRVAMIEKRGSGRLDSSLNACAESVIARSERLPKREILLRQIDEHVASAAGQATGAHDRRILGSITSTR